MVLRTLKILHLKPIEYGEREVELPANFKLSLILFVIFLIFFTVNIAEVNIVRYIPWFIIKPTLFDDFSFDWNSRDSKCFRFDNDWRFLRWSATRSNFFARAVTWWRWFWVGCVFRFTGTFDKIVSAMEKLVRKNCNFKGFLLGFRHFRKNFKNGKISDKKQKMGLEFRKMEDRKTEA